MSCNITAGIEPTGCEQSLPGIKDKSIWVFNREDVTAVSSSEDGLVDGITLASGASGYKIDAHKNTANFIETAQNPDNSGSYYDQTVAMRIVDDSLATVKAVRGMKSSNLLFIMQNRGENFYVLGELEGLEYGKDGNAMHESGSAPGDDAGRMLTFTGVSDNAAPQFLVTDTAATITYLDNLVTGS